MKYIVSKPKRGEILKVIICYFFFFLKIILLSAVSEVTEPPCEGTGGIGRSVGHWVSCTI